MNGQVVLITGGSHGIGEATALELASRGAKLLLAARDEQRLSNVCQSVRSTGAQVEQVQCDVAQTASVRHLFQECERLYGRLDVLFNNAGVGQYVPTALTTDEIWDEAINVNLRGASLCVRESLPLFEKSGGGLIINNASVAAKRGFPNFAAYCASKAGLLGLSNALREELREKKIRVSVIMPGATDTPFWDHVAGDWNRSLMIRPEQIAQTVAGIVEMSPDALLEEVTLMPAGGAL